MGASRADTVHLHGAQRHHSKFTVAEAPELLLFRQEEPLQEAGSELGAEAEAGVYRVKGAGGGAHSRQREGPVSKL